MCLVIYINCQLQYCACLTFVHLVPKEYNLKIIALFFAGEENSCFKRNVICLLLNLYVIQAQEKQLTVAKV